MLSLKDWLRSAETRLRTAGIESAKLDAQLLAAHILRVDRAWLLAHPEHEFPELAGESLLQRREQREPLAYLLGWREFYSRRFRVRPGVLIPRQETETLIEAALSLPFDSQIDALDIGTGSGILVITLKLERPSWRWTALDVSAKALDIAQENGDDLKAEIEWVQSDLFAAISDRRFDLIVSNPPYIGLGEALMPEVRNFEPHGALFAGDDGLDLYERLAQESASHLKDQGWLLVEVGHTQAESIQQLFSESGWDLQKAKVWNDLSGVKRVLGFQK